LGWSWQLVQYASREIQAVMAYMNRAFHPIQGL
jgi:hypothetical protein